MKTNAMYDMDSLSTAEGMGFLFGVLAAILLIFLVPAILYLVSMRNTLRTVSPENRATHPDNAFLLMIPLFNLVYYFFMIGYVADSLGAEFRKRGIAGPDRPTYSVGLAAGILWFVTLIPILGSLASLGQLVCWIIHWIQMVEAKNKIKLQADIDVLDQGMKS